MHKVFEQELLEFIIPGGTKKWILLLESCQDFHKFFVMYDNEIPHVNGMKELLREGIKLCDFIFTNGNF